jgi:hypothetical protein
MTFEEAKQDAIERASRTGFDWYVVHLSTGYETVSVYARQHSGARKFYHAKAEKLPRASTKHQRKLITKTIGRIMKRPLTK